MKPFEAAALWSGFFNFVLANFMVNPFLGLWILSTNGSYTLVGTVFAVNYGVGILARIPFARLADKYGRLFFVELGIMLHALGLIIFYSSSDPSIILLATVVRGLGFATYHPSMLSMMVEKTRSHEHGGKMLGYLLTAPAVAQSIGPTIGALTQGFSGFRGIFLASAFVCFAGAILVYLSGGRTAAAAATEVDGGKERASFMSLFSRPLVSVMYSRFAVSFASAMVMVYLPLMAVERLAFAEWQVGALFSLAALFNIIGRPISVMWQKRIGNAGLLNYAVVLVTLSSAFYAFTLIPSVVVAMLLWGLGAGIFVLASVSFVSEVTPEGMRTLSLGLLTVTFDIGLAVASVVAVFLLPVVDYSGLFVVGGLVSVSGMLVARVLGRRAP
jgi:MFS family permease